LNRFALLLFLGSWCFFTLFHPGKPLTVDSKVNLDTVRAMARGGLAVPEAFVTRKGRGGLHYSLYGPLLPVLSLPAYKAVSLFESNPPAPGEERIGWADRAALGTNQWISAAIVTLIYLSGLLFGVPSGLSFYLSILAGISTMVLPYSRDYFSQPAAALGLLACFYFLLRWERTGQPRWMSYASVSMGFAVLARMDVAVAFPGMLASGFLVSREIRRREPEEQPLHLGGLLWPFLVCAGGLLLFDRYRWGSWTGAPYGGLRFDAPLIDSLPRFLFSRDLSVFLYNPLLVASVAPLFLSWRSCWRLWTGILLCDAFYLILVGKYQDFHGGICPGPRYLLALVPLNLLPLAAGLARTSPPSPLSCRRGDERSHRWLIWAGLGLLALPGILVNGYSAVVDYGQAPSAWIFWKTLFSHLIGVW
jgi:hypothetical protein